MARKLVAFNPSMEPIATRDQRFSILLHSLPKEDYRTIVDSFDAQSNLNLDHAIRVLQEKEATLEVEESANWAKRSRRPSIQQKSSRPNFREGKSRSYRKESSLDNERPKCFLCYSRRHKAIDCPNVKDFRRWQYSKSKLKLKDKDIKRKDKDKGKEKGKLSKKGYRAFAASSLSDKESTSSSENDKEEEVGYETAALSKELAGKPSSFVAFWVADSGASSHITNQLQLFRQPIIPIKRRVIKVGGGRLYADQCGTAVLRAPDSNKALLVNVLYVPLLGVNLLSRRKLCQRGLIGHFNKHYL